MSAVSSCPSESRLEQFLLGQLPAEAATAMQQHIEGCPSCRERLHFTRPGTASGVEPTLPPRSDPPSLPPDPQQYDFLAPAEEPDELGRLGQYRILQVLGAGGMGVVFLAEDPALKRRVALKTLRPALAASSVQRQRFLREAQATAKVEHDHIVTIYQVDEDRGVPFLAMQLLKGRSLDDHIKQAGRLPLPDVLRMGREMAEGLEAAHSRGLIHRDIKPANVWLEDMAGGRRRVKLVDFGLARGDDDPHLTGAGHIVGTPAYMAPEQAQGKPVDGRTDLFSLGCVLYRIYTGRPPFQGNDLLSTLLAVTQTTPPPPRQLLPETPPAFDALVMRLLSKNAAERPASAREVADVLAEMERDTTLSDEAEALVHDQATGEVPLLPPRRRFAWMGGVAALLVVAGVGTAGFLLVPNLLSTPTSEDGTEARVVAPTTDTPSSVQATPPATALRPGVLIIEGAPAAVLVLRQNGKVVRERVTGRVELPPGDYDVALAEWLPNTAVEPARLAIRSGEPVTVRIKPAREMIVKQPGEALSGVALVSQPERLERVHAWTLETRGHRAGVRTLAYSPDGKWLATGGEDGTIRLWDARSGSLERILIGHDNGVAGLVWSPDGTRLVSRGLDSTVRLWEAATATPLRVRRHLGMFYVAWSPDGKRLAVALGDHDVTIWDAASLKNVGVLKGHTATVRTVAWSPDGNWLASGGDDRTVRLVRLDAPEKATVLRGHEEGVTALAWSPDSKWLASGSRDATVRLWDPDKGEQKQKYAWDGGAKTKAPVLQAQSIAWLPKGQTLSAIGPSGVQMWKPGSEKPFQNLPVTGQSLAWAPDGVRLASAAHDDETVRIADGGSGKTVLTLAGCKQDRVHCFAWSPEGKFLAWADEGRDKDRTVRLWNAGTATLLHSFRAQEVVELSVSAEGKRIAAVCQQESKVYLWNGQTGKPLPTLTSSAQFLSHVVFSPDGRVLAAAGNRPGKVFFWDADTGQLKAQPAAHDAAVTGLSWSPDGKTLASSGSDSKVLFWSADGKPQAPTMLRPYNFAVTAVAWSPDGKRLATAGHQPDAPVKLWDAGGKFLKDLKEHQVKIVGLVFLADGKTLVGRGDDGVLRIWDTTTGQMRNQGPRIGATLFLPQHGIGATSSGAASLRLVEFGSTKTLATLAALPFTTPDSWLVLSPEGRHRNNPKLRANLLSVVQTDQGQELLPLDEFRTRFKLRNEREGVQFTAPGGK